MNRRRLLLAAGGGLALPPGGCLDLVSRSRPAPRDGTEPTAFEPHEPAPSDPPELPAGPQERPEHPTEVTVDSVSEYVAAFEYAYVYNTLHCSDLQSIEVTSKAGLERETPHGVYAFAAVTGFSRCGSAPEPDHNDFGRAPFEWAVGEEYAVRIDTTGTRLPREPEETYQSDTAESNASGFSITNFDHRAHDIDVSVVYHDELAFEETIALDPRSGILVPNVSSVRGDHEISVRTGEGASTSGTWTVDPERTADRMVRILVTGRIAVEQLDPYEAHR